MKTIEFTSYAIKNDVEKILGFKICESCFEKALAYGQEKLNYIIKREGDAEGKRKEDWYLADLISEHIKMMQLNAHSERVI